MHSLTHYAGTRTAARAAAVLIVLATGVASAPPAVAADAAHTTYMRALGRERELREGALGTLAQLRRVVETYESVVRRYPRSGYADNALWQGGNVALRAFERFGQAADKKTAIRLLNLLREQYPASSLVARAEDVLERMEVRPAAPPPPEISTPSAPVVATAAPPAQADPAVAGRPVGEPPVESAALVTIREIRRTPLPDGVRVSIEMDGESLYRSEKLDNPRRVFFDVKGARATPSLQDATLKFTDDIVREIRLGRHPRNTTRIVMDLESVESYSVFTLYNPFRLVVDFTRTGAAVPPAPVPTAGITSALPGKAAPLDAPKRVAAAETKTVPAAKEPVPLLSRPVAPPLISPASPTTNSNGQFSLARQLGLGVSRIVLDAGHGGHDPGARANGLSEAELVLDVTLRLRDLLLKQPGVEVTLTRDADQFVPLEERTAMANRKGADLFLSIHANASRNPRARGIETYFLNFASNPEAEAVAARENSASGRTMHSLPEIVRAIALNNKIDESRDFADMVQKSMIRRLSARNAQVRDLGVKQAPFVVLIGAGMPSVLAEISFVTNRQEGTLLKTPGYRQQIAESLLDAILRYQRSLKGVRTVAAKE